MHSSADHSISPPHLLIPRVYNAAHDLIDRNLLAGRGQKLAYIDDTGRYPYDELAARVNRFANALTALDVQMEQRVVLCLYDTIDFPVAFLGCIKAGIIPVAVNTLLSPTDFEYALLDSRCCALVISAPLLTAFEPCLSRAPCLKHVVVSGSADTPHHSFAELLRGSSTSFDPAPTTCDDMCFWLYSSGSTGPPKGTVHAHASLIRSAELYARPVAGFSADDIVFSPSKLAFAYGLGNSLTFPLAVGATAVLMAERPTPAAIAARLREHQPTVLCTIPTAYAALLASAELPARETMRLRICISAGEALPEEVGRRWRRHFDVDILDGIGSTEMLHIYLSNRQGDVCYGTTGMPVPGYDVRIVADNGATQPAGETGELYVRGPTSALLYWNNRARSCSTFLGEWIKTGDKFHQREDGRFVYEGRADDMLKVSGLYVSPAEVEAALVTHDAVLEAAVVAKLDAEGLVKPCAFVVLKSGCGAEVLELQRHVKSLLAPYKYPRWIEVVPTLPKTVTGKVQRFKLREQATML